jgi:DNA invertase Pin-like site-specific DNA recombinase
MVRQILGAVSQFEKAMLVAKLKGARERKRAATGKCEGRKTYAERSPQMVTLAKRLHRYTIDKRHRSLRDIAAELEAAGYTPSRWQETHRSRHLAHDLCVTSGGTRRTGPRLERR